MSFRILFACLTFLSLSKVFAQDNLNIALKKSKRDTKTYIIKALDGEIQRVCVLPDYQNHVLTVICVKDTIRIDNYWGIPPVSSVLNKTFVKIKYEVRGGSNLGLGNVLIVCVNRKKIYPSLHINEYSISETSGEYSTYKTKLDVTGNNKYTFKISAKVHDLSRSKDNPETNYDYVERSVLHFDKKRNVFYSIKKSIYKSFTVEGQKSQQMFSGNFPVILLGDIAYYYLNNKWWELNTDNHLVNVN